MPRLYAALLALAVTVAACGSDDGAPSAGGAAGPPSGSGATKTVTLKDIAFAPEAVEVEVGDTVKWVWKESISHNVVAADGTFESEFQTQGQFSHTFDEAGTYDYVCTIHPGMEGTVTVTG